MAKPILWGGLAVGASIDEALAAFPEGRLRGRSVVIDTVLFDCDFGVTLSFDETGFAEASLNLARIRLDRSFIDTIQDLIAAMSSKHGRGQARQISGDMLRKRWREPWLTIDLVAVDDVNMPTICVTYSKLAITDAALRFL